MRKRLSGWTLIISTCIVVLSSVLEGQSPAASEPRSTGQGVYNREQWMRGRDVYAGMCAGCHPAVTHVGPVFTAL